MNKFSEAIKTRNFSLFGVEKIENLTSLKNFFEKILNLLERSKFPLAEVFLKLADLTKNHREISVLKSVSSKNHRFYRESVFLCPSGFFR